VPVLEQVLDKYPKDIKIVYKNFPLPNHKHARKAASAALVAQSQGKFWEFHDLLFQNYNRLNDQLIFDIALSLGFDKAKFEKNMKDIAIQEQIGQDMAEGQRFAIRATPTVFINGRLLRNDSLKGFQAAIDEELLKIGKKVAKPAS
jgi:protein-disulfide isomerase